MYILRVIWIDGHKSEDIYFNTLSEAERGAERIKFAYDELVKKVVIL